MTLYREFVNNGRVHRFIVTSQIQGWNVTEEEDSEVLQRVLRNDWHRVERDVMQFEATATSLKHAGWTEH